MIRVFVGCAPNGEDAESQAVLEYSIRRLASEPVEIVWMRQSRDPQSFWHGWATQQWATPFSGFRWGIPAACNFEGRAIYCDSDVIFCADIAELWHQAMAPGHAVLAKHGGRMCVSLWDCAAARAHVLPLAKLKTDPRSHGEMGRRARAGRFVGTFEGQWNCLDGQGFPDLGDSRIKAIHYTDMSCQPQLKHALPRLAAAGQKHWFDGTVRAHPRPDLQALFDLLLEAAAEAGFRTEDYLPDDSFGAITKKSLTGYKGHGRHAV